MMTTGKALVLVAGIVALISVLVSSGYPLLAIAVILLALGVFIG